MKKLLLIGLPILAVLIGLPILALAVITTSTTAAADCRRAQQEGSSNVGDSSQLGDLGVIDGPVGGPVEGEIGVASANIPNRSGLDGFRASMPRVLSTHPDFVTVNEVSGRTLAEIEAAAPGYSAYREPAPTTGAGADQSMGNVVLWKNDVWTRRNGGRVQLVEDDKTYYAGRPVVWDRFATWALMERKSDGAVVSIISVHQMTNPHKFPRQHGNPPLTRPQQYGEGMDILLRLANSLATHGPVLVGGDMNTHASYTNLAWSAAAKMNEAGYRWYDHDVDFVFFPQYGGVTLIRGWTGPMVSDHQWVAARLAMNGAGPTQATVPTSSAVATTTTTDTVLAAGPASDVHAQLMQLRFAPGYPTMTAEQANNAIEIAQIARDLNVPRYALEIAIATSIQESKLVNLPGGDADSAGLFQQRPSAGWGTRTQITTPRLAAEAFFGEAKHTNNPGLLDIPNWEQMPLTEAAASVQNPRADLRDAYAPWEPIAKQIAGLLGGDLPDVEGTTQSAATECAAAGDTIAPVTLGTLNLLGAGHTDGKPDGRQRQARIPRMAGPAARGNRGPRDRRRHHRRHPGGPRATGHRAGHHLLDAVGHVPGHRHEPEQGHLGPQQLGDDRQPARPDPVLRWPQRRHAPGPTDRSTVTTGQSIWVWSVHNPADTRGDAASLRMEALSRELDTLTDLTATGTPTVIMGDFNDAHDAENASHCTLTPTLVNAFGGSATPCRTPAEDAAVDHIYGANLTWASAQVDHSVETNKVSDHPLVMATTAGTTAGCAVGQADYNLGPVKPQLTRLVDILGPMFDITTVGGYRADARDPLGHPAGLAADFMVPTTPAGKAQGDDLAAYAQGHAGELGVDYIIWYQRIWSVKRAAEGWRPMEDRGDDTENHTDHVHINVLPTAPGQSAEDTAACGDIVYPVPAQYVANDAQNWHDNGNHWASWHTGTDFGAPCGTTVFAAHAGTVEIDTTESWAGPWLVKVTTGPDSLTTWYAHMQKVTVSRGETVAPGQQIGEVGDQGNSEGCHLHFEVHLENGSIYGPDNVDPSVWLADNASRGPGVAAA